MSYIAAYPRYIKPESPPDLRDRVRRATQGDQEALGWFCDNIGPQVVQNAKKWIKDPTDQDEFVSRCFLGILKSLPTFETAGCALTTWVWWQQLSQRSKWFGELKAGCRSGTTVSIHAVADEDQDFALVERYDPTGELEADEELLVLLKFLDPLERRLVVLRHICGYTVRRLADETGIGFTRLRNKVLPAIERKLHEHFADQDLHPGSQPSVVRVATRGSAAQDHSEPSGGWVGSVDLSPDLGEP